MNKVKITSKDNIRCTKCNEPLNDKKAVWLELSQTDGRYYDSFPEGHISQGGFPFGKSCAKKVDAKEWTY